MRNLRFLALFLSTLSLSLATARAGLAKDYRIDKVAVQATIREDGSVRIVEKRVYSFRGQFHWASYRLPLRGIGRVDSFQVREGDRVYRLARTGQDAFAENVEKRAGGEVVFQRSKPDARVRVELRSA